MESQSAIVSGPFAVGQSPPVAALEILARAGDSQVARPSERLRPPRAEASHTSAHAIQLRMAESLTRSIGLKGAARTASIPRITLSTAST